MEMVRAAGLEPAKPKPRDFKSLVFTNFTTPALIKSYCNNNHTRPVDLETLLSTSDVVTVHSNLTAKIEHLISKAQFGMMKPTAILLNAARPHCRRGRAFLRTRP